MEFSYKYNSKIGDIYITADENSLLSVGFKESTGTQTGKNDVIKAVVKQLDEYFSGKIKTFDLPLNSKGSEFQKKVWKELQKIPYGETRSYKEIAAAIGNPKAARAVGNANNKNPIAIIIPCHRVIGSNRRLIGYAGGIDKKEILLKLEKSGIYLSS